MRDAFGQTLLEVKIVDCSGKGYFHKLAMERFIEEMKNGRVNCIEGIVTVDFRIKPEETKSKKANTVHGQIISPLGDLISHELLIEDLETAEKDDILYCVDGMIKIDLRKEGEGAPTIIEVITEDGVKENQKLTSAEIEKHNEDCRLLDVNGKLCIDLRLPIRKRVSNKNL